jgi:hypothetical protein
VNVPASELSSRRVDEFGLESEWPLRGDRPSSVKVEAQAMNQTGSRLASAPEVIRYEVGIAS